MKTEDQPQAEDQPTEQITRVHTVEQAEFRTGIWFNARGDIIDDADEYARQHPARALYLVARDGNRDYLKEKDKNRKELKLDNPKMLKKVREIGFIRATCIAMSVAILLDWRNVYSHEDNEDGSPKHLDPTVENRRKVLLENPAVRELVQELAADFEAFDEALREHTAGKLQRGSSGGKATGPTSVASNS